MILKFGKGRSGRVRMVVGVSTTCAISPYHHWDVVLVLLLSESRAIINDLHRVQLFNRLTRKTLREPCNNQRSTSRSIV
jgi:hypothetical protein